MKKNEIFCKVFLLGEEGVGKTSIKTCFINNTPLVNSLGIKTNDSKTMNFDGKNLKFFIWDMPAKKIKNEYYQNQCELSYFIGTDVFFLIYDITNKKTFIKLKEYYDMINGMDASKKKISLFIFLFYFFNFSNSISG